MDVMWYEAGPGITHANLPAVQCGKEFYPITFRHPWDSAWRDPVVDQDRIESGFIPLDVGYYDDETCTFVRLRLKMNIPMVFFDYLKTHK